MGDHPYGPIVIACAMAEEAAPFIEALRDDSTVEPPTLPADFQGPLSFRAGELDSKPVIVATTGIGMTNAALAATLTLLQTPARFVIFAGTTGGLGVNVQLGDVIVGRSALYHDADASAFGYEPGQIPQMPTQYWADPNLAATAEASLRAARLPFHGGGISASDSFVTAENAQEMRAKFPNVLGVDMETAAAAQVCWSFQTPWVSLRAVSDLCSADSGEAFTQNAASAITRSYEAVSALLRTNS